MKSKPESEIQRLEKTLRALPLAGHHQEQLFQTMAGLYTDEARLAQLRDLHRRATAKQTESLE